MGIWSAFRLSILYSKGTIYLKTQIFKDILHTNEITINYNQLQFTVRRRQSLYKSLQIYSKNNYKMQVVYNKNNSCLCKRIILLRSKVNNSLSLAYFSDPKWKVLTIKILLYCFSVLKSAFYVYIIK